VLEVRIVHLYADVLAGCEQCGCAGAPTSREWIEYGLTLKREAANQRSQCCDWLLGGMKFIAAVRHLHHIAERLFRQRRSALGQQERHLVLIAEEPAPGAVRLMKHDVADRLKTGVFPGVEEHIDLCPAVKHDCDSVLFEHAIRSPIAGLSQLASASFWIVRPSRSR
jgi:hypothetical protein